MEALLRLRGGMLEGDVPRSMYRLALRMLTVSLWEVNYDPGRDEVTRTPRLESLVEGWEESGGTVRLRSRLGGYRHLSMFDPEHDPDLATVLEEACRPDGASFEPEFPWLLRPYQHDAYEEFARTGALLLAMPTGSGKTIVGLYAAWRLRARTLVLVPTRELVDQWVRMAGRVADACSYRDGRCTITVATYQAFRDAPQLSRGYCLLVADEGHHLPAEKWMEFAKSWLWPARLVLTATPVRGDGNHTVLRWFTLWHVYRLTYSELVEQGWLAPLEVDVVWVPPSDPERLRMLRDRYRYARSVGVGAASLRRMLERALKTDPVKEAVAARLAERLAGEGSRVIIFSDYVDQVDRIASRLQGKAARLHGRMQRSERQRSLELFRAGLRRILVASPAGDEGIDVPDADVAIMLSVPSRRQLVQRLGRILRPKPLARLVVLLTREFQEMEERKLRAALAGEGVEATFKTYSL